MALMWPYTLDGGLPVQGAWQQGVGVIQTMPTPTRPTHHLPSIKLLMAFLAIRMFRYDPKMWTFLLERWREHGLPHRRVFRRQQCSRVCQDNPGLGDILNGELGLATAPCHPPNSP